LADGVVGSIALGDGSTLQILPKIGQVPFLQMMLRGLEAPRDIALDLGESLDPVVYGMDAGSGFGWLVARRLFVGIEELMRFGLATGRSTKVLRSSTSRGRILPLQTSRALDRHESDPVFSTSRIRTLDHEEHRVLRAALRRALPLVDVGDFGRYAALYQKWQRRTCAGSLRPGDLDIVQERAARQWYGGSRPQYRQTLVLALVVLGMLGTSLDGSSMIEGDTLLLNSSDVFERFVRNAVAQGLGSREYVVTKGGTRSRSLYTDGSQSVKPDVVVERSGRVVMILDAKYKHPSSSDHYQMVTYLSVLGVDRGVLVTPWGDGRDAVIKRFETPNNLRVYEIGLPLEDLAECERLLASALDDLA